LNAGAKEVEVRIVQDEFTYLIQQILTNERRKHIYKAYISNLWLQVVIE